jgi:hypothetical protein
MKRIFILAFGAALLITSCNKDSGNKKHGIFKGPEVQVYDGKAWTWVQIDPNGAPLRLAVSLTDAALKSMPASGHGDGHSHGDMWTLKFHSKANVTPFNHLMLNWNPNGHEPEIFYGKPHFDFHFYTTTPQEVAAIPPYDVDSLKFKNWPAPSYFPANYFNPGGGVPQMGAHWVDPTSGEFNGLGFTETFIFGSFDGKVTFYEPMITKEFLMNNANFERSIPQPAKVQKTGYYPTKQRVIKHDGLTEIILDKFVYRTQS